MPLMTRSLAATLLPTFLGVGVLPAQEPTPPGRLSLDRLLERIGPRLAARPVTTGSSATWRSATASSRADEVVLRKAPVPHFTSRIRVPAPSASFFDMMEPTISGSEGTVAVTSRKA